MTARFWQNYRRMREQVARRWQLLTTSSTPSYARAQLQKCVDRLQVIALTHPEDLSVVCDILDKMIAAHVNEDAERNE